MSLQPFEQFQYHDGDYDEREHACPARYRELSRVFATSSHGIGASHQKYNPKYVDNVNCND